MAMLIGVGMSFVLLGYLAVSRNQDSAKSAFVTIAAACAGMALASFFAIRSFANVFDEISRTGGGIGEVSRGVWQATLMPTGAAIAAALVAVVGLMLVVTKGKVANAGRSRHLGLIVGALMCGALAVLLFRNSIGFVLDVITPGSARGVAVSSIPDAIATRLLVAAIGAALCFAVAVILAVVMMRKPATATLRTAIVALVVTLLMSSAFAASLYELSDHYRMVYLHGRSAVTSR